MDRAQGRFARHFIPEIADEVEDGKLTLVRPGAGRVDFRAERAEKLICASRILHNELPCAPRQARDSIRTFFLLLSAGPART